MRYTPLAAAVLIGAFLTGCSTPPLVDDRLDPERSVALSRPSPPVQDVIRWEFDGTDPLVGLVAPGGAQAVATVATSNGGELRPVESGADGTGGAVGFPEVCDGDACPRVTLEVPDHPDLSPGARPFAFGVSVLLEFDDLSAEHGSNLVQKGVFSTPQWKLQIEGSRDGRPSCVVRTTVGREEIVVKSSRGVADGTWHRISCRRGSTVLEILVDEAVTGSAEVPPDYLIDPGGQPLVVGSKGPGTNNDQFHGVLDDVFFAVG